MSSPTTHKQPTLDDVKVVIDHLLPFEVWEKAVKQSNRGKNKNDLVEDGWKAPLTSYLRLIMRRLNQMGFATQRGSVTTSYLLKLIRSEGDDGLHYLFGDEGLLKVLPYIWGYTSEVKTKLMVLLNIKTRNFEKNKCSKNIRSVSERLKVALDHLQGYIKVNNHPNNHKSKPKPYLF